MWGCRSSSRLASTSGSARGTSWKTISRGELRNLRTRYEARLPPKTPESLRLIHDGGIANYTCRILEERRKAAQAGD